MLCWLLSFVNLTIEGKRGQCPCLHSRVLLHMLKIFVAHWLKISALKQQKLVKLKETTQKPLTLACVL